MTGSNSQQDTGRVCVIGAGNMGGAMLGRWLDCAPPGYVFSAVVRSGGERWQRRGVAVQPYTEGMRVEADVVLLAVKPHQAAELAATLQLTPGCALVSVLAGITHARLCELFPAQQVFRVMPNTPFAVGEGVTLLAKPERPSAADAHVQKLLELGGTVSTIGETDMDFCTALTGSGPAFLYLFAEALVQAATQHGLDEAQAQSMVAAMLRGASGLLCQSDAPPQALRQAVTSPKGVTAEGVRVLQEGGLASLVGEALAAAAQRSAVMAGEYS